MGGSPWGTPWRPGGPIGPRDALAMGLRLIRHAIEHAQIRLEHATFRTAGQVLHHPSGQQNWPNRNGGTAGPMAPTPNASDLVHTALCPRCAVFRPVERLCVASSTGVGVLRFPWGMPQVS